MLTLNMIMNSISEMLYQQYPTCRCYIQDLPATFERPSFHIYLEADRSEDGGISSTGETVSLGIVYYPSVDGGTSEELKRMSVYDGVKSLFKKGFVRVGDRALKVTLLRGGRQQNDLYLIVKLVYTDDRPYSEDGSVGNGPYPLIQNIKIKTN